VWRGSCHRHNGMPHVGGKLKSRDGAAADETRHRLVRPGPQPRLPKRRTAPPPSRSPPGTPRRHRSRSGRHNIPSPSWPARARRLPALGGDPAVGQQRPQAACAPRARRRRASSGSSLQEAAFRRANSDRVTHKCKWRLSRAPSGKVQNRAANRGVRAWVRLGPPAGNPGRLSCGPGAGRRGSSTSHQSIRAYSARTATRRPGSASSGSRPS